MGTISKRGIEEFGSDVKERVDELTTNVGQKLDDARSPRSPIDVTDQSNLDASSEDHADMPHQIERLIAAMPSTTWLTLAGASIAASALLRVLGRRSLASFVGQLTPSLLIAGLYNKLTKVGAATALLSSRRFEKR